MYIIKRSEIKWLTRHYQDPLGMVFRYNNSIYRIINNDKVEWVKELFSSGLISEAIDQGYLVDTWVNDSIQLEGYEDRMIIEHKYIEHMTYSFEWSEGMFSEAALCVVRFNMFLLERGYELFDPSPGNVAFVGCKPVYLDLGSIADAREVTLSNAYVMKTTWIRSLDLMKTMRNDKCLSQFLLQCPGFDDRRYALLEHDGIIKKIANKFDNIKYFFDSRIIYANSVSNRKSVMLIRNIFGKLFSVNPDKILLKKKKESLRFERMIKNNKRGAVKEYWSDYHNGLVAEDGHIVADERIDYYSNVVAELQKRDSSINSSFEIAGNSGAISQVLVEKGLIKKACVSDYDDGAIDKGFRRCFSLDSICDKLSFAVLDLMDLREMAWESKYFRFKSDILFALAVTHHLILVQKVRMEVLVDYFAEYTNRYFVTEFMPLGLYDGSIESQQISLPEWYTLDWFLGELSRRFNVLKVEEISKHRIAIIAEKRM